MKTRNKALLTVVCAVLLVIMSVFGTLAYLTDTEAVTNTFTVGTVDLALDEAKVKADGSYVTDESNRTVDGVNEGNEYHLIPGHTYYKDPTVTVLKGSEETYVRMLVTLNYSSQLDAIFGPAGVDLTTIFNGYDPANWNLYGITKDATANTRTYEFRYVGTEFAGTKAGTVQKTGTDIVLDDLFDSFTIPGGITKEQLATLVTKNSDGTIEDQFKITVVAHAIQADGFDTADLAWAEF